MTPYDLYLDLLARTLTGELREDPPIDPWHGVIRNPVHEIVPLEQTVIGARYQIGPGKYDAEVRRRGRDWPETAETMIGAVRLANLRELIERIYDLGIPGDFLEAGVWRGGACIFMRGVLAALESEFPRAASFAPRVFACDSFAGLPPPACAEDVGDLHHQHETLNVSLEEVQRNFARYGFLDERTIFVKGLFKDALAPAVASRQIQKLALLRLDGDMYESTTNILTALYPQLSSGGFCIIDDFNLPPAAKAVSDYLGSIYTEDEIVRAESTMRHIDGNGIYFQKP